MGMINKYERNPKPRSTGDHRDYDRMEDLPEESIGKCINHHRCFQNNVELADGLCMGCWDKTVSSASTGQRSDMSGIKDSKQRHRGASVTKPTYGKKDNGNSYKSHPFDK